jgi:hypothetical protein
MRDRLAMVCLTLRKKFEKFYYSTTAHIDSLGHKPWRTGTNPAMNHWTPSSVQLWALGHRWAPTGCRSQKLTVVLELQLLNHSQCLDRRGHAATVVGSLPHGYSIIKHASNKELGWNADQRNLPMGFSWGSSVIAGSISATGTSLSLAHLVLVGEGTRAPSYCKSSTTSVAAGVTSNTFSSLGACASRALPGYSKPKVEDGLHRAIALWVVIRQIRTYNTERKALEYL